MSRVCTSLSQSVDFPLVSLQILEPLESGGDSRDWERLKRQGETHGDYSDWGRFVETLKTWGDSKDWGRLMGPLATWGGGGGDHGDSTQTLET